MAQAFGVGRTATQTGCYADAREMTDHTGFGKHARQGACKESRLRLDDRETGVIWPSRLSVGRQELYLRKVQAGDIAFTMLGAGRSGAIRVCQETGMRQIGDGIDWCAMHLDVFLASAVADSGWGSFRAIESLLTGQLTQGRRETVGLENPAICRLATAPDVSPELRAQLETTASDILRGTTAVAAEWNGAEFDTSDSRS